MRAKQWIVAVVTLLCVAAAQAALSANGIVRPKTDTATRVYPVLAAVHIYTSGFVGLTPSGQAKPFVPGDVFIGIASEEVNAAADVTDGTHNVTVYVEGDYEYAPATFSAAAATYVSKPVFATADDALAATGHPDGFVGTVVTYLSATKTSIVRLRRAAEKAPSGCVEIVVDFGQRSLANLDDATATSFQFGGLLKTACIGAGMTAGTTGLMMDEANGEARMLLDNDSESENLTFMTPQTFNIAKGVTFEITCRLSTAGTAATDDVDFGLMGLAGGITATEQANMDATTGGLLSCKFHLDANANDVFASSDDNASPVTATDTTFNNSLSTNATYIIICRPTTGACETWVNGARKLGTTAFSVGATGMLAGIVILEKSTGTAVPEVRVLRMRVAGAVN